MVRNRATVGGNLADASPAADSAIPLLALKAQVKLQSLKEQRTVGLDKFFTAYRKTVMGPIEMLTAIDVRIPAASAIARWQKVGTRRAQSISKVVLCGILGLGRDGRVALARVALGSVTDRILHTLHRPLLIVPPGEPR
jgi:xanthine dehydrogenase iron-sulfur cluster and FAD-binding subunit A